MKLTTSKNNEYEVDWIDSVIGEETTLVMQMHDSRKLLVIASEFDDLEWLKRESKEQGDKEWHGYTELQSLARVQDNVVLLRLIKR